MIKPKNYGGGSRRRPGRAYRRKLLTRPYHHTARERRARLREWFRVRSEREKTIAEVKRLRELKANPKLPTLERLKMAWRMRSKRAQLRAWRKKSRWPPPPTTTNGWVVLWYLLLAATFVAFFVYKIQRYNLMHN